MPTNKTIREGCEQILEKSVNGYADYITEKLKLNIYQANILSKVEDFVADLDKEDRETLLYEINVELEEIKKFFYEKQQNN